MPTDWLSAPDYSISRLLIGRGLAAIYLIGFVVARVMSVEAGAGTFPLALERQLVGQHRGATLSLRVPYPADYPNASLAGRSAAISIKPC